MNKTMFVAAAVMFATAPFAGAQDAGTDVLVVYFSRADENYGVGVITEGNTKIIAKMIAEATGAEIFEIVPKKKYSADYKACCDVAQKELRQKARPEIEGTKGISRYHTIFIGYPNWWGDMPMCVYTFIETQDWSGKTVIPFCTHEGSELGATVGNLKNATGADVKEGVAVRGTEAQKRSVSARNAIASFLKKNGF